MKSTPAITTIRRLDRIRPFFYPPLFESFPFSRESWISVVVRAGICSGFSSPCVLLLTLKEGDGRIHCADGRTFYLWKDAVLREIFARLNLEIASFFRNASAIGTHEPWLGYVFIK
jgi:hypothetical protein